MFVLMVELAPGVSYLLGGEYRLISPGKELINIDTLFRGFRENISLGQHESSMHVCLRANTESLWEPTGRFLGTPLIKHYFGPIGIF